MACHLFATEASTMLMLRYCQLDPKEHISVKLYLKIQNFPSRQMHLKMSSAKWQPLCSSCNFYLILLWRLQNSINSLSTGRCLSMPCNFKSLISKHVLLIKFMNTCEIAYRWMPQNTFDDKSVNFASVNGLVLSGNKPWPAPIAM